MAATVIFTNQAVNPGQQVQNAADFTPAAPIVNGVAIVTRVTFGAALDTAEHFSVYASTSIDGVIFTDVTPVQRISEFDPSTKTVTASYTLPCPGSTKIRFFVRNNDSQALVVNNLSVVAV